MEEGFGFLEPEFEKMVFLLPVSYRQVSLYSVDFPCQLRSEIFNPAVSVLYLLL
jgi:hypothetical protein